MKRHFIPLALVGLAAACGGDDSDKAAPSVKDAGEHDAGTAGTSDAAAARDAASDAAIVVKVTDVGSACTSASSCQGAAPVCEAKSFTQDTNPGGSCSAACTASAECGPKGVCPVGELITQYQNLFDVSTVGGRDGPRRQQKRMGSRG